MKIAFIGAGAVFGFHGRQLQKAAPDGSSFYVVEPDKEIAALSGLESITLKEAVKKCDLAAIMTPSFIRWDVCEPFIDAGKGLIVEKPLCLAWREISLFEKAAKKSWICPVVNARFVKKVRNIVENQSNPKTITSWKVRDRGVEYYSGWHGKYETDGGVLAQQGFHSLDLVCWAGGTPLSVSAKGQNRRHKIECEDTVDVEITFQNGAIGKVYCTTAGGCGDAGLEIVDSNGTQSTSGFMYSSESGTGHKRLYKEAIEAFTSQNQPPVTVADVVPSLQAMHAAYLSMDQKGKVVNVGTGHKLLGTKAS